MNEEEYKISDTKGRFLQAIQDGRKIDGADWRTGRIILSNRRLVLVGNDGKRTISLDDITHASARYKVNATAMGVTEYVTVEFDRNVVMINSEATQELEVGLYRSLLNQEPILIKHPAVKGGVVQNPGWKKAIIEVEEDAIDLSLESGSTVRVERDDVGSVSVGNRTVRGQKRTILEVEHTEDDASVQTYIAGEAQNCSILQGMLQREEFEAEVSIELDETEKRILMALYSGVSSFEIPEFLDLEIDDVESVYEDLIERGVLEEVRVRREVDLNARGRNLASVSMNEEDQLE